MDSKRYKGIKWFLTAGASGFALYLLAFNSGQAMLNSSTSSIVIAICPVVTAILARFIYHEHLRWIQWISTAFSIAGFSAEHVQYSAAEADENVFRAADLRVQYFRGWWQRQIRQALASDYIT
jgi:hypothetical protein